MVATTRLVVEVADSQGLLDAFEDLHEELMECRAKCRVLTEFWEAYRAWEPTAVHCDHRHLEPAYQRLTAARQAVLEYERTQR